MATLRDLRADTQTALEKRRFVAWLRGSDPQRIVGMGQACDNCTIRTYLWEVLSAAHHDLRGLAVYYDRLDVWTDIQEARLVVPGWANRLMHRLANDDRVERSFVLAGDVRRIMGV